MGEQNNPSQAANNHASDVRSASGTSGSAPMHGAGGLPTPASLAELILSTRQFLSEQAGESLLVCPLLLSVFYSYSLNLLNDAACTSASSNEK